MEKKCYDYYTEEEPNGKSKDKATWKEFVIVLAILFVLGVIGYYCG